MTQPDQDATRRRAASDARFAKILIGLILIGALYFGIAAVARAWVWIKWAFQ